MSTFGGDGACRYPITFPSTCLPLWRHTPTPPLTARSRTEINTVSSCMSSVTHKTSNSTQRKEARSTSNSEFEWILIEQEVTSPFKPIKVLSQTINIEKSGVCQEVCKKISYNNPEYLFILYNNSVKIGKQTNYWAQFEDPIHRTREEMK